MLHVVNDRQNRDTQKMNDREEEINRTEKLPYRKDSISTMTINSQTAHCKTSDKQLFKDRQIREI